MDNLTHSLAGYAVARIAFPHAGRWAPFAAVIAANAPDADVVTGCWGHEHYLLYHRGVTHGLPGIVGISFLMAAVVFGLLRWQKSSDLARTSLWKIWLLCALAMATHLPLDGLNSYGIRPFTPFSEQRYFGDVLFVLDPNVWLILGLGLYCGVAWSYRVRWGWYGVFGLMALVQAWFVYTGLHYWVLLAGWVVLLGSGLWYESRQQRTENHPASRKYVLGAVGLFALYVSGMCLLNLQARRTYVSTLAGPMSPNSLLIASPMPGAPWCFTVISYDAITVQAFRVNTISGDVEFIDRAERRLDDPALNDVKDIFAYRVWTHFARVPVVERRHGMLVLGDARFGLGKRPSFAELFIPLAPLSD